MKMATRKQVLIEVVTNLAIGLVGGWIIYMGAHVVSMFVPSFVWNVSPESSGIMVLITTAISFVRQYALRSYFTKRWEREKKNETTSPD
jgi:hypothetical protein